MHQSSVLDYVNAQCKCLCYIGVILVWCGVVLCTVLFMYWLCMGVYTMYIGMCGVFGCVYVAVDMVLQYVHVCVNWFVFVVNLYHSMLFICVWITHIWVWVCVLLLCCCACGVLFVYICGYVCIVWHWADTDRWLWMLNIYIYISTTMIITWHGVCAHMLVLVCVRCNIISVWCTWHVCVCGVVW